MADTRLLLRGLILTASELKRITDWPDALVEDYLNILNNLIALSNELDDKSGILKNTVRVSTANYTPQADDQIIFCDTDIIPIQIDLPEGSEGADYRIINAGSSGNNVTITPFGAELLFGLNASEYLIDEEVLDLAYNTDEGWW